eukprot:241699-Chlamydomonas_euryale.AAC.9
MQRPLAARGLAGHRSGCGCCLPLVGGAVGDAVGGTVGCVFARLVVRLLVQLVMRLGTGCAARSTK